MNTSKKLLSVCVVLLFLAVEPCYGLSVRVDKKYITNGTREGENYSIVIKKNLPDEVEKIAQEHLREYERMLTSPKYSERKRAVNILTAEGRMNNDTLLFYLENNLDKKFHNDEYEIIRAALPVLHERMVEHEQATVAFLEKVLKTTDDQVIAIHSAILLLLMDYVAVDELLFGLKTELQRPLQPFGTMHPSMKYLVETELHGELELVFNVLFSQAYTREEMRRTIIDFLIEIFLGPRYYERARMYAQKKLIELRSLEVEPVRIDNAFKLSQIMEDVLKGKYDEPVPAISLLRKPKAQEMMERSFTTAEQRALFIKTVDAYLALGDKFCFNLFKQIDMMTEEREVVYYSNLLRDPDRCTYAGNKLRMMGIDLNNEQYLIWAYSATMRFARSQGLLQEHEKNTVESLFNKIKDIDDPRVDQIYRQMLKHDDHVLRTLAFLSLLKRRQPTVDEIQRYYSVTFKDVIERHERALLVREYIDHLKIVLDDAALKKHLQGQLTSEDRMDADIAAAALKRVSAYDDVSNAMKLLYDIQYLEGLPERNAAVHQYYDLLHQDPTLFRKLEESGTIRCLTDKDLAREMAEMDPRFDDDGYGRSEDVRKEKALAFDTIALQGKISKFWSEMKGDAGPIRNEANMLSAA